MKYARCKRSPQLLWVAACSLSSGSCAQVRLNYCGRATSIHPFDASDAARIPDRYVPRTMCTSATRVSHKLKPAELWMRNWMRRSRRLSESHDALIKDGTHAALSLRDAALASALTRRTVTKAPGRIRATPAQLWMS